MQSPQIILGIFSVCAMTMHWGGSLKMGASGKLYVTSTAACVVACGDGGDGVVDADDDDYDYDDIDDDDNNDEHQNEE